MHLHLPHFCLDFVLEKIRISMYFYVLRTHILFSFDHIFFTVTGMIHYCSMYTYQLHQSEAKKMNLYFLGKNE